MTDIDILIERYLIEKKNLAAHRAKRASQHDKKMERYERMKDSLKDKIAIIVKQEEEASDPEVKKRLMQNRMQLRRKISDIVYQQKMTHPPSGYDMSKKEQSKNSEE